MQTTVRNELTEMQATMRREAGEMQAILRQEAAGLQALIRRDLAGQVSASARELRDAAEQVKGMVRRLTPLWANLIGAGGLILGIVLSYIFVISEVRDIKGQLTQMQQAAPVSSSPPQAVPLPTLPSRGAVHPKPHGSRTAIQEPKVPDSTPLPVPLTPDQP